MLNVGYGSIFAIELTLVLSYNATVLSLSLLILFYMMSNNCDPITEDFVDNVKHFYVFKVFSIKSVLMF